MGALLDTARRALRRTTPEFGALDLASVRRLVDDVPAAAAIAELVTEERDRCARRELRASRGTIGKQPRCKNCNVFVTSISATCSACGWEPGLGWAG